MKADTLRVRFNLSRQAIGFAGLYQELLALPNEKAMRTRILTILHEYSQSVTRPESQFTAVAPLKPPPTVSNAIAVIEPREPKPTAAAVETNQEDTSAQVKAVCDAEGYLMHSD